MISEIILSANLVIALLNGFTGSLEDAKVFMCKTNTECSKLAEAAYFEARGESTKGVKAVMKVILNRKNKDGFPNTIKGVVNQPYAFSYLMNDRVMRNNKEVAQWRRMYILAFDMLTKKKDIDMKGATHYHTVNVHPKWAKHLKKVATVGNHVFYK